ncbi:hypothetical protein SAMD00019534_014480 [Acytostelium subglobosum LB1]|uniref:hypothetical protein n=1 Tax=Acytostelium subglobosum LB1 TaxID=1410327 RepID=UPI0006449E35|nr:hypothetical protein SAMD00019534_014480 [Acytostelium subglobosum LB1]GAM18273.1 hypothetical protein SAMD00019534_014480 [Acytostelium subglobosum LB1]|eukprot:XP_012758869.1 hypothetical protein SAMD00019534_014480 [Acytostelium subglobosum LB1]
MTISNGRHQTTYADTQQDDSVNSFSLPSLPLIIIRNIVSRAWRSHLVRLSCEHYYYDWNLSLALVSKDMFKFVSTCLFTEVYSTKDTWVPFDMGQHIANPFCVIKSPSKLIVDKHIFKDPCESSGTASTQTFFGGITNLIVIGRIDLNQLVLFPSLTNLRLEQKGTSRTWDSNNVWVFRELPQLSLQNLKRLRIKSCNPQVVSNLPDGLHLSVDQIGSSNAQHINLNPNVIFQTSNMELMPQMISKLILNYHGPIPIETLQSMPKLKHLVVSLGWSIMPIQEAVNIINACPNFEAFALWSSPNPQSTKIADLVVGILERTRIGSIKLVFIINHDLEVYESLMATLPLTIQVVGIKRSRQKIPVHYNHQVFKFFLRYKPITEIVKLS